MKVLDLTDLHMGYSERTFKLYCKMWEEVKDQEWDILIINGDLASNCKEHFRKGLKFFRDRTDKPILLVRGNHDHWEKSQRRLNALIDGLHHDWFRDYAVHHLESAGPYVSGDVTFVGWDGWYAFGNVYTNDGNFMPSWTEGMNTWTWLQHRAHHAFGRTIDAAKAAKETGQTVVCVTHFPILDLTPFDVKMWEARRHKHKLEYMGNIDWWPYIREHIDYFFYGHTHIPVDALVDGVQVINVGSCYDKPKYKIVDII